MTFDRPDDLYKWRSMNYIVPGGVGFFAEAGNELYVPMIKQLSSDEIREVTFELRLQDANNELELINAIEDYLGPDEENGIDYFRYVMAKLEELAAMRYMMQVAIAKAAVWFYEDKIAPYKKQKADFYFEFPLKGAWLSVNCNPDCLERIDKILRERRDEHNKLDGYTRWAWYYILFDDDLEQFMERNESILTGGGYNIYVNPEKTVVKLPYMEEFDEDLTEMNIMEAAVFMNARKIFDLLRKKGAFRILNERGGFRPLQFFKCVAQTNVSHYYYYLSGIRPTDKKLALRNHADNQMYIAALTRYGHLGAIYNESAPTYDFEKALLDNQDMLLGFNAPAALYCLMLDENNKSKELLTQEQVSEIALHASASGSINVFDHAMRLLRDRILNYVKENENYEVYLQEMAEMIEMEDAYRKLLDECLDVMAENGQFALWASVWASSKDSVMLRPRFREIEYTMYFQENRESIREEYHGRVADVSL